MSAPEVGTLLSDVLPERVSWLWRGRIPCARLTLLDGDPGTGKSQAVIDLAARVTNGWPMPEETEPTDPGGVVLCGAEDDLASTVRPRLDAAGADCSRVLALTVVPDDIGVRPLVLPDDLDIVRAAVERIDARLLVFDPLAAFLSGTVDSHKDADIRRVLFRVAQLAEETGVAVLVVRHLTKQTGGSPLYRGSGSIGIVGAARSGLLVAKDPDDDHKRVLASVKSNLAELSPSMSFHIETVGDVSRVVWDGESRHSAAALVQEPGDPGALEEAKDVLADLLTDGPMPSLEVRAKATQEGVSWATLRRAASALDVRKQKEGMRGGWVWSLPEKVSRHENVSTFAKMLNTDEQVPFDDSDFIEEID